MNKSNYNNKDKKSPFKKGDLKEIVKRTPHKRLRYFRPSYASHKEEIDALTIDLVQVFANYGINIKNVQTIAKALIELGWICAKKPKG